MSARRGALLLRASSCAAVLAAAPPAPGAAELVPQDSLPGAIAGRALPRGGRLAVYTQPAQSLVSIRVAFELPRREQTSAALTTVAQRLVRDELERLTAFYGAKSSVGRSATHAAFTVTGAASDFPALVGVLQRALAPAQLNPRAVEIARLMAEARVRQEHETPEPLLRRRLAAELFPDLASDVDTVPRSVSPSALRAFWRATFAPERMQVVVVGPLDPMRAAEVVGSAHWGVPDEAMAGPLADSTGSARDARAREDSSAGIAPAEAPPDTLDAPQVLFPWTALAWRSGADPATLAVAARLLERQLPARGLRTARAELWWSGARRALVVLGAAATPPDSLAPDVPATLAGAVTETLGRLAPADVAVARQLVAREILYAARTPDGMARFLGELFERTGEAAAGQEFLLALDRVDAGAVESALRSLGDPSFEEIRR